MELNLPLVLGDLEMEVLGKLWALGSGDVRSVHQALQGIRNNHSNTVQSALERLYRKGVLDRERQGHAYIYRPNMSPDVLVARLIEDTLQRIKGAKPLPALAAFVDLAAEQDPHVLEELERLLNDHRGRGEKR